MEFATRLDNANVADVHSLKSPRWIRYRPQCHLAFECDLIRGLALHEVRTRREYIAVTKGVYTDIL